MQNEEYKIEIENTGDYKSRKEFNKIVMLNERQYLALVGNILDFLDKEATSPSVAMHNGEI